MTERKGYRSTWNGAISFGLVSVPIKLIAATHDHDISFKQLHGADSGRISYQRVCAECNEVVDFGDIVKGFESSDGQMVQITDEDLADLEGANAREMEVVAFIDEHSVDTVYHEKTYYCDPNGSTKGYVLLRDAMTSLARDAVVSVTLRNKARMGLLCVDNGQPERPLVLHTLRWHDEVRLHSFNGLDDAQPSKPAELKAAQTLIGALTADWNPAEYIDTREQELRELIDVKLGKRKRRRTAKPAEPVVDDLLAALEASIAKRQATTPRARSARKKSA